MLQRVEHENGVVTYQSPLLRDAGVRHGFSTRLGGVSRGPYASLNLGSLAKATGDENTSVAENFRRLRAALGCERLRRIEVRQVHGCAVWLPPMDPMRPADAPQADAICGTAPDAMLAVRVADCVPLLLADITGRCVAAIHAGWRGLVAGVIAQSVEAMRKQHDIGPHKIIAAIGPCISAAHFEVGQEVAEAFSRVDLAQVIDTTRGVKPHIDLREAARLQLLAAGVETSRIDSTACCTYRDEREFFSHRRDAGLTGRMAAVIAARP